METDSTYHNVSIQQFSDWVDNQAGRDNPLGQYSRTEYSCYIDYKHMKDMFSNVPDMLQEVDWSVFGLDEFDGKDSTIWLSSEGANTPVHQDSYGFNLVTQLLGRKLWILFPPEDSKHLYPTRVPYEESSIFSQVNILSPNTQVYPLFKESSPVVVTLCPGQTLYVPRHWWHFVYTLEPAISVNVWVPLEDDKRSRLEEAVTRCLATSIISSLTEEGDNPFQDKLLNPTESLASGAVNLLLLETTLSQIRERNEDAVKLTSGNTCADKFNAEKDYLRIFAESLAAYDVIESTTPFLLDSRQNIHDRKRKHVPSGLPNWKKTKHCRGSDVSVNFTRSHNSDVKEDGSGGTEMISDFEATKCKNIAVFSLRPCTFDFYLNFLESLHHEMHSETGSTSQDTEASSSESKEMSESGSNASRSGYEGCSLLEMESKDQQEESKTSPVPPDPRLGYSPPSVRSTANSSVDQLSSTQSEEQQGFETKPATTGLGTSEIAEALLASASHPDVIHTISNLFMEHCERMLLEKSKKY